MTNVIKIETTVGTEADAERIADDLLNRNLAACVQIQGPIVSRYRWQGQIESSREWLVALKTTGDCYARAEAAILELHSYETPEILAFECVGGASGYVAWVRDSVT